MFWKLHWKIFNRIKEGRDNEYRMTMITEFHQRIVIYASHDNILRDVTIGSLCSNMSKVSARISFHNRHCTRSKFYL